MNLVIALACELAPLAFRSLSPPQCSAPPFWPLPVLSSLPQADTMPVMANTAAAATPTRAPVVFRFTFLAFPLDVVATHRTYRRHCNATQCTPEKLGAADGRSL